MHTLLFDIDGTLIRSGGAGFSAMSRVVSDMFGIQEFPQIEFRGRTDRGIIGELFDALGQDYDVHGAKFSQAYLNLLPAKLHELDGHILPGVVPLLGRIQKLPNVAMGILTGNSEKAAKIKLDHFDLSKFFDFGGFGDDHQCRNDVAALAKRSAESYLSNNFDPGKLWVIGDTVNDIRCGRSISSRVVAVETGGVPRAELAGANPDALFATLEEADSFLALFE